MIARQTTTTISSNTSLPITPSMASLTAIIDTAVVQMDCDDNHQKMSSAGVRRESCETLCTEGSSSLFADTSASDLNSDSESESSTLTEDDGEPVVISATGPVVSSQASKNTPIMFVRSVRFSNIEIRSYPIVLGDNPSVTCGIPVTIDWQHDDSSVLVCDVVEYEETRPARRNRSELMLPPGLRARMAMETGSSRKELREQQKQVNIQRARRRRTLEREQLDKLEEMLETTWRRLSGKKKRENKFIQQATTRTTAFAAIPASC